MAKQFRLRDIDRLKWLGLILFVSICAFELYNFDSTRYSLSTFFGDLTVFGIPWAVVLAVAFCGVDFAGVAQLFTPQRGKEEPTAVWYLFGAWLLATVVNAFLTWWAVLSAMTLVGAKGNELITAEEAYKFIPVLVSVMVWLSRLLLIGVAAFGGDHLINRSPKPVVYTQARSTQPRNQTVGYQQQRRQQSRRELRQDQTNRHNKGQVITLDELLGNRRK